MAHARTKTATVERIAPPARGDAPFEREVLREARSAAAGANGAGSWDIVSYLRGQVSAAWLAIVFVALTFVLMLAGRTAQHLELPAWTWWACYLVAYIAGGSFAVRAAWQSLRQLHVDVDLLMILAALGAAYIGNPFEGALLLFLFSLSNVLQAFALRRTRRAIRAVMKLRPKEALTRRGDVLVLLPIEELQVGDRVVVRPGESIPLDGVVAEGESSIDESSITGESMPVTRSIGEDVFAGTMNQTGGLEIDVSRLARDSTIARMIRLVEQAQSEKARAQRFLDRFSQWYAMSVIAFTLALIAVPTLLLHHEFTPTFYRAITVMVVASPCALIISTPASILSAIGGAARRGVLFKGGAHLESAATVTVVAIDKTGTLTLGRPRVTDVMAAAGEVEAAMLQLAASVEAKSEHPLARAIVEHAARQRAELLACSEFQSVSGQGASGVVDGRRIAVGNVRFYEGRSVDGLEAVLPKLYELQDQGKTSVIVASVASDGESGRVLGLIAIADVLRPDAAVVMKRLRDIGIKRIVMLTGDNDRVARAIAREAGIDEFHAELLPEDKVRVVREIEMTSRVAMVGDGVNDAPALASATVGMAMGAAGTDVAMETADVVLMGENLDRIPFAIGISRRARRVIIQNLVFAMGVIVVLVIGALGFNLPLPMGVVGHEGSTVLVVLNGLRLLAHREA
jgi:Cd2+/Zn2+-exporting ATPase